MRVEVVAVGTELLLGQIVNTNAQTISQELAEIGVDVLFHVTVGDNEQRIADVIGEAFGRSDAVIITGGLGPTHDDLTREAIATATSRPLSRRPELEAWLVERFQRMGRPMADNNLRQAELPEGADALANPRGSAPGIKLEHEGKLLFALPGVPVEMEGMLSSAVIPMLAERAGNLTLASRVLKVAGMGESDLATRIQDVIADLDDPSAPKIALLAAPGEVRIRITAKGPTREQALALTAPIEERLVQILGSALYGTDSDTLESVVAQMMVDSSLTLATAESFTGGMLSSRLVDAPGASKFLNSGYVVYDSSAKTRDLGVPAETIERHGAVSKETVLAMAEGVMTRAGTDLGLATTGEAGPRPDEDQVGTMFLGLAWKGGSTYRHFVVPGERDAVRRWGTYGALNLLRLFLLGELGEVKESS